MEKRKNMLPGRSMTVTLTTSFLSPDAAAQVMTALPALIPVMFPFLSTEA